MQSGCEGVDMMAILNYSGTVGNYMIGKGQPKGMKSKKRRWGTYMRGRNGLKGEWPVVTCMVFRKMGLLGS